MVEGPSLGDKREQVGQGRAVEERHSGLEEGRYDFPTQSRVTLFPTGFHTCYDSSNNTGVTVMMIGARDQGT